MTQCANNMVDTLLLWILFLVTGILAVSAVDVQVNDEVEILCPADLGKYPTWTGPSNSALTNGTNINEDGFSWLNETHLKITSVQTIHSGNYTCSNGTAEGTFFLNVLSFALDVKFLNIQNDGSGEYLRGTVEQNMTVTCQVTGGSPEPNVTFILDSTLQNQPNLTEPDISSEFTENNTYTVNASVTFRVENEFNNKTITCSAVNGGNVSERSITFKILYPPLFRGYTFSPPDKVGSSVKMSCWARSRPKTSFYWMVNRERVNTTDNTATANSVCEMNVSSSLYDCESNMTISNLQKNDTGKNISCEYVYEGTVYGRSDETRLSIQFEATKTMITGNTTAEVDVTTNVSVRLTCSTDPSNPASTLLWRIGRQENYLLDVAINSTYQPIVNESFFYDGKSVSQDIDVPVNRSMNGMYVFCCLATVGPSVCDRVTLNIFYPPQLLAPQLDQYRAYVGDDLSVPCIADARPFPIIAWYRADTSDVLLTNNTAEPSNMTYLQLTNLTKTDAATYKCKAWMDSKGVDSAVAKSISLVVLDKPTQPALFMYLDEVVSYVEFSTSATAPATPRKFYVQYRKNIAGSYWLEVDNPYQDTLPGHQAETYRYKFKNGELLPNSVYEIRLKSVDAYGLVSYSATNSFRTAAMIDDGEETVSYKKYRDAILISVLVTAGGFIIIIVGIICFVKHGKCLTSSAKSYVM